MPTSSSRFSALQSDHQIAVVALPCLEELIHQINTTAAAYRQQLESLTTIVDGLQCQRDAAVAAEQRSTQQVQALRAALKSLRQSAGEAAATAAERSIQQVRDLQQERDGVVAATAAAAQRSAQQVRDLQQEKDFAAAAAQRSTQQMQVMQSEKDDAVAAAQHSAQQMQALENERDDAVAAAERSAQLVRDLQSERDAAVAAAERSTQQIHALERARDDAVAVAQRSTQQVQPLQSERDAAVATAVRIVQQVRAMRNERDAAVVAAERSAQQVRTLQDQLAVEAPAVPRTQAEVTPSLRQALSLIRQRHGELQAGPLLDLATNHALQGFMQRRDVLGLAGQLTNDQVAAIKAMPFINATVQISYAQTNMQVEEQGWKNTVALLLVLLSHLEPADYDTLAEVSQRHHGLTRGDFNAAFTRVRERYRNMQDLDHAFVSVMFDSQARSNIPIYVRCATFMIIGRMLVVL